MSARVWPTSKRKTQDGRSPDARAPATAFPKPAIKSCDHAKRSDDRTILVTDDWGCPAPIAADEMIAIETFLLPHLMSIVKGVEETKFKKRAGKR